MTRRPIDRDQRRDLSDYATWWGAAFAVIGVVGMALLLCLGPTWKMVVALLPYWVSGLIGAVITAAALGNCVGRLARSRLSPWLKFYGVLVAALSVAVGCAIGIALAFASGNLDSRIRSSADGIKYSATILGFVYGFGAVPMLGLGFVYGVLISRRAEQVATPEKGARG